ncbi:hypothetical protein BGZ93_002305 [Podila epicladia]|nr:hypothetical protein BGZ93_002305 [Podila epicladia]
MPIQSVSADGSDVSVHEVAESTSNAGLPKNESKDKDNEPFEESMLIYPPTLDTSTHHDPLDSFYNGNKYQFKRHVWDTQKAKEEEYVRVANSLLHAVGGSIGAKRDPDNKVVIAIGMSNSFQSYFVNKARSLGYLVVGVNEHYTSQKCPTCQNFVARVGKSYRRLYCETCCKKLHRDTMAAHNMCNIVLEHLLHQRRPLYLQPRRKDGTYPWMDKVASLGNTAANNTLTSNGDSTAATGSSNIAGAGSSRKRKGSGQTKSQSKKPTLSLHSTAPLHAETAAVAKGRSALPSSNTTSSSITAGTKTTGSMGESKAHSASRPKQPHVSGKHQATKDSTKRKAKSDNDTKPKKPRAAKRVVKATREDPTAVAGAIDKVDSDSTSTSPSRNARPGQAVLHTTTCAPSKAAKVTDSTLATNVSPGPTTNTPDPQLIMASAKQQGLVSTQ